MSRKSEIKPYVWQIAVSVGIFAVTGLYQHQSKEPTYFHYHPVWATAVLAVPYTLFITSLLLLSEMPSNKRRSRLFNRLKAIFLVFALVITYIATFLVYMSAFAAVPTL